LRVPTIASTLVTVTLIMGVDLAAVSLATPRQIATGRWARIARCFCDWRTSA
jgi:hypothetical protein